MFSSQNHTPLFSLFNYPCCQWQGEIQTFFSKLSVIDISLNLSYFIELIMNWTTNHNLWSFLWIFPWSYPWSLIISLTLHHRMKRWLRIDQVRNIKRWLQLQLLLIPLPTRSSIAVFLILHYISTLFYYFYTDCYYFHGAFLKKSGVWKNTGF